MSLNLFRGQEVLCSRACFLGHIPSALQARVGPLIQKQEAIVLRVYVFKGKWGGGHFWKDACCVSAWVISVRNTLHMASYSLASIATNDQRPRADDAFTYTRVTDYNNKERRKRRSGGESET